MANFQNKACTSGGVSLYDPLFFTCNIYGAFFLRVVLPTGDQEYVSLGDTAATVSLPRGFTAVSLIVTEIDELRRNFHLTLFINSAYHLNGGEIKCDSITTKNVAKAGCLIGKLHHIAHCCITMWSSQVYYKQCIF